MLTPMEYGMYGALLTPARKDKTDKTDKIELIGSQN